MAAVVLTGAVRVAGQRGPGGPPGPVALAGLSVEERQAFDAGARVFARTYDVAEGLGPVFNDASCNACHRGGNGSNRTVTRIGRAADGGFDPLDAVGGSLLQSRGIGEIATADGTYDFQGETVPPEATTVARRRSQPLLGLGLVDAVPDEVFHQIAGDERDRDPATAGRVSVLFDPATGGERVGRFGWKAQVPSLRAFSADALLNEMGITSPGFRDEVCPQGDCAALAFNPTPALNDDGGDVAAIADFMTLLAPAPAGPSTTRCGRARRRSTPWAAMPATGPRSRPDRTPSGRWTA